MLDVDRGVDVDASGKQLLDIEIPLWVPAPRSVGVRQLVDQRDLGLARKQTVEVHLLEYVAAVVDAPAGDDLETREQCFRLGPAVCLDHAYDDVDAFAPPPLRRL